MVASTSIKHRGRYTIRAMRIANAVDAQIFEGRKLIGPRHTGSDKVSAIAAAEEWLDIRDAAERAERKKTGVPSVQAYAEAFAAVGLNRGEHAMVHAHLAAPWHKLTANELAKAAGWPSWSAANLHYGGLGRKIAEFLDWPPPTRNDGTPIWTMAIAVPAAVDDVPVEEAIDFLMSGFETGGEFEWTLRPQVVAAFARA